MSDNLIYWICHDCGIIYSKKYKEGFKCPSGHSIYEVETLDDDQEEIYKIGLKQGNIECLEYCIKEFKKDMINEDSPDTTLDKFEKRLLKFKKSDNK